MSNITLDIYKSKGEMFEVLTFDTLVPIRKPMFSLLNVLESVCGKFLPESTYNPKDTAYADCQKAIFVKLFGDDILAYLMDDYIEKNPPIDFLNVRKYLQLEIMAIEEFCDWLDPGATGYRFIDYETGKVRDCMFSGKTPSKRYTESMSTLGSNIGSPSLIDDMLNTLGCIISLDVLLDNRSFIPIIKSKRYSQFSDDIRDINIIQDTTEQLRPEAYKVEKANKITYVHRVPKRTISRCYYTSNGIFPLIWAEIKYAIENDINIRQCKCCKKFFEPTPRQKYTCDECRSSGRQRRKSDILKYGSIENCKKAESLRQKKHRAVTEAEKEAIQQQIEALKIKK